MGLGVQRVMKWGLVGEGRAVRCGRGCGGGVRWESMGIIEYIAFSISVE